MKILSIESSCDETAAAITEDGRKVISSVIATQIDEHKLYGGVVPEIASRRHCENITGVCEEALEKGEISSSKLNSLEEMYEEYVDIFHGNGYVKTLITKVRKEVKIVGKYDT